MFIKLLTEKDLEGNPSLSLRLNAESLVVNSSDASAIACSSSMSRFATPTTAMFVGAQVKVLHFISKRTDNKEATVFVFPVPGGPQISLTEFRIPYASIRCQTSKINNKSLAPITNILRKILTALRPHIRKRNQISSLWFIWCSTLTLTIITLSTSLQANFVEQIIRRLEICRGFNFQDLRSRGITERVYRRACNSAISRYDSSVPKVAAALLPHLRSDTMLEYGLTEMEVENRGDKDGKSNER
nr:hypothetical protein VIGAN_05159700 [Ipomoea batatas]